MVAPPRKGEESQNHVAQGLPMDRIIGRTILYFSLATTAIVAIAAIVYLVTGAVARFQ